MFYKHSQSAGLEVKQFDRRNWGGTVGSLTKKCARPIFNNYSKKIFFQKNVITHVISKDIAQNSQISNFCL